MKKLLFSVAAAALLFSSCTKEESLLVPGANGNKVFSATFELEENQPSTRLHLNTSNSYVWDAGDGVGVSSAKNINANVPAYSFETTTTPTFSVDVNDYRFFGEEWYNTETQTGEALYFYYPYSPDNKLSYCETTGAWLDVTIPSEQRYAPNTFYKNTVPAVAYVDEYKGASTVVDFDAPVSILKLRVKGYGSTENLQLKIQKPGTSDYYKLSGYAHINVPVVEDENGNNVMGEVKVTESDLSTTTNYINLTFGNIAEDLSYYEPFDVYFVIPVGLNMTNATIELSNGDDKETLTLADVKIKDEDDPNYPNYYTKADNILALNSKVFNFGTDNSYVIDATKTNAEAALDFITYAYLTQVNQSYYVLNGDKFELATGFEYVAGTPTAEDYNALASAGLGVEYKALLLVDEIDFTETGFNAAAAEAKYNTLRSYQFEDLTDMEKVQINALKWYLDNGAAINSLGYNGIIGGNEDATVIKGLKVNGNGLVGPGIVGDPSNPNIATLKNLEFANTTVVADKDAQVVGFISAEGNATIEDLVIGEGNAVDATAAKNNAVVGGLVGRVNTNNFNIEVAEVKEIPALTCKDTQNAGQIYGTLRLRDNMAIDLADYKVTTLANHPAVHTLQGKELIDFTSTLTDYDADSDCFGLYVNNAEKDGFLASVVVNGVSYWNGDVRATAGGGDYFTAEELAYVLETNVVSTVTLTHNIDMQNVSCKVNTWGDRGIKLTGSNKQIKNIVATPINTGFITLFGNNAEISNVTLNNILVDGSEYAGELYGFSGIAMAAVNAENVKVNGLELVLPENITFNSDYSRFAGIVFGSAMNNQIENVEVNNSKITYAGSQTFDKMSIGAVVGRFSVTTQTNGVTLPLTKVSSNKVNDKFVKAQGVKKAENIKVEKFTADDNHYGNGSLHTYGTLVVTNPVVNKDAVSNAEITVAEGTVLPSSNRLASGIVFNFATEPDAVSLTEGEISNYNFTLNGAVIGLELLSSSYWSFTKE